MRPSPCSSSIVSSSHSRRFGTYSELIEPIAMATSPVPNSSAITATSTRPCSAWGLCKKDKGWIVRRARRRCRRNEERALDRPPGLKGDSAVLKKIDEAEAPLCSLRKALSERKE